jgi:PAS domain S-box-containing protein
MSKVLRVLIVEDSESDACMLVREMARGGYSPLFERVDTDHELKAALARCAWDLVLSDYTIPGFGAVAAAVIVAQSGLDIPFIVISGSVGEEAAAEVMKAGAHDFILKRNLKRLLPAIERETSAARARATARSANSQLDQERVLLRQLMEGTPDSIYFKDVHRRYTHLNDAECALLGAATREDALGKIADAFVPVPLAQARRAVEEKVLSGGDPEIDYVEELVGADGAARWICSTVAPIRDPRNKIVGLVGIGRDITEAKRQEQMKGEFIATVSHELRTPLASILGAIGVLAGKASGLPNSANNLLAVAHRNCHRLVHIVNDILDIEKLEAGKMVYEQKPFDVCAAVEQTIEANLAFAQSHGVSLRLEPPLERALSLGDPGRFNQAITNLISNAVKFSPRGAAVVVTIGCAEDHVRISVRDYGPGIPDAYKDRVFEKFVQVDASDARAKGGTGLGLPIAKQIIMQLGGDVCIENAPGGGSVFVVRLRRLADAVSTDDVECLSSAVSIASNG